ncbi:hypothetical protein D9611_003981 [Ephemerocybe angulata]|uniref:Uncharacterized protein n=1 Tax=Ephemerocybe angulata TaxID=980116 RepID=A0A8H5B6X1_9AGAR|nr:hypothetical protein D9611_003981 [Tulosesus angulatus]
MPIDHILPTYDNLGDDVTVLQGLNDGSYYPGPSHLALNLMDPKVSRHRSRSRQKKHSGHKHSSSTEAKSPHRTPLSIAQALVDEERQSNRLRNLEAQLAVEIRRVEEAVARAEWAERREKEALATIQQLEDTNSKLQEEMIAIETSSRNYQVQLELTEREFRLFRRDDEMLRDEFKSLDRSYRQSQEQCRKHQASLRDCEARLDNRETTMHISMQKCFFNGEGMGYETGFSEGYREGRKDGKQSGIRLGRKEGLQEGLEQGRAEERRNALDAIDKFLAKEGSENVDTIGIRRWAQSVYYPPSQRSFSDIGQNPVAP